METTEDMEEKKKKGSVSFIEVLGILLIIVEVRERLRRIEE